MVTTVCLNPSIDRTLLVDRLIEGGVNRVRRTVMTPSGKGINVAVALQRLGVESTCVGFLHRENCMVFDNRLAREGVHNGMVYLPGTVRTNYKIWNNLHQTMTQINEAGSPWTRMAEDAFWQSFNASLENSEVVVMSGSLPVECPKDFYGQLIRRTKEMGKKAILDAEGFALIRGIEAAPYMVKPDETELAAYMGRKMDSKDKIIQAAETILEKGVTVVVVTMGSKGAYCFTREERYFVPALKVIVRATVGAGDSFAAGMAKGLAEGADLQTQLRYGVAAAASSLLAEGTALLKRKDFESLAERVTIQAM
ncbi:1-phosphofructokinase family hexose kinase [Gehongia tenuis]|uniref:Tagatose-6-phosphate kinase n=1 Tax=Gehongia tenuis TaxID=2763655 RepID=A0A926HPT0_9FIRM|nr:1-phosphofructokinase family hexose kinase [Gehongia tenuis]MBC8531020.1 1-phosphofructokinase family hexose kinase [Gehongia tenuis]